MRNPPASPAAQLSSIAHRYRYPLAACHQWVGSVFFQPGFDGVETGSSSIEAPHPALSKRAERKRIQLSETRVHDDVTRLEAVLFIAKEPLHTRKLAQYAELTDGTQTRTLARQLNQIYDRAGRAFRIEEVAGGLQLRTRKPFASWLRRLGHVPPELKLSAPAMETLVVVAYRQPVLRADIEAIRGVGCGEILRQLMERDLVRVAGRSEELGRPYVYGTTKHFLELFGFRNLDELPRAGIFQNLVEDQTKVESQAAEHNMDSAHQGESE